MNIVGLTLRCLTFIMTLHLFNVYNDFVDFDDAFSVILFNNTEAQFKVHQRIITYAATTESKTEDKDSNSTRIHFIPKARTDGYTFITPEESAYAVYLAIQTEGNKPVGSCSGSLLTPEWVITAAHCLNVPGVEVTHIVVYAGGNSAQELVNDSMPAGAQKRTSVALHPHPKYKPLALSNNYDIGLVKVEPAFDITKTVDVTELSFGKWPYHGYESCRIVAFGTVIYNQKHKDDGKRKLHNLRVKSPCLCNWRLKNLFGKTLTSKWVCSQPKEDFGVCPGDSGSGLICGDRLVAVTSMMVKVNPQKLCQLELLSELQCGSDNSLNIFMGTCPYVRWVNDYVHLVNESLIPAECYDWGGAALYQPLPVYTLLLFVCMSCLIHEITSTTRLDF